jgi:GH24 family phage-related lysozyme (muramidase)
MEPSEYFDDLLAHEGCTTWLYCDSRGFVTVGIGNLVASPEACAALPFHHMGGDAATRDEKLGAYVRIQDAFDKSHSAEFYRGLTDLRLTQDFVRDLVAARLASDFLPGIVNLCPGFADMPAPARHALVDMAYNLGVHGLAMFPHMLAACNAGDWEMAAHQCHRSTCRGMRNVWTAQQFIDAEVSTPRPDERTP